MADAYLLLIKSVRRSPALFAFFFAACILLLGSFLIDLTWRFGRENGWSIEDTRKLNKIVVLSWFPVAVGAMLLALERILYFHGMLQMLGFKEPPISSLLAKFFPK